MTLLALSSIFPIVFMLQASVRTQAEWAESKFGIPAAPSLDAFARAWVNANIGGYFINSVIVTVGGVTLSVIVAATAGFAFAKIAWKGRSFAYYFILAWMAVPPLLLMVPIYVEMVDLHLIDTYWSVIFLYTAVNTPFNVFLMTAFFRAVPDELLEAARVDGASIHAIFRKILVPLSIPAIATLVIFNALYIWNEFVFALLLLHDDSVRTLTVGVMQLQGKFFFDYPALMAGLLITSIPVIGVYLLFQRYLVRAIAAGALK
jgi:ABC-type glycerol-3-phosphate transport system permease component